jgi:CelD/BcsL family acetyltransferase involved in cellulose biosynthesis
MLHPPGRFEPLWAGVTFARVPYTFEWVEDERDFDRLAEAWDELVGDEYTPFDTHRWYRAWWTAFGGQGGVAIGTAWQGNRLAAVFPLRRRRGGGLIAMANVHTPLYRPVGREPAATALVRHVLASHETSVELIAVPEADPVVGSVRECTRALNRYEVVERLHVSPIVETVGTFDAWRKLTKPRWRSDLDRFARNLRRRHSAEFSIVQVPTDPTGELDTGFRVEASGWKGEQRTAIQSSPQTETFYRNVAKSFHDRGQLRLSRIVLPDGCAAFDLCLLTGQRLYLLKTGFDERFRNLSPGLVLRLATIERCFELGLEAHELLGDDAEWKRKFATTARPHRNLRYYRRRPLPPARWIYRKAVRPHLRSVGQRIRRHA